MYPSGSAAALIYGTPKIQMFSSSYLCPKLRPIVSSIENFNYDLARFFFDLLSPVVSDDYSWKETFSFVSGKFLVSDNVTSLFTNIPLQKIIDIGTNLIFYHNLNLDITKKELKKLFIFAA